jgi:NHL repeat
METRTRTGILVAALTLAAALLAGACGGGGSSGGRDDSGPIVDDAEPPAPLIAIGFAGGGQDGWRTDGDTKKDDDLRSFKHPLGVFVAADGFVYVADAGNDRIVKWAVDGTAVGWIGQGYEGWQTDRDPGVPGARTLGYDIVVDADGNIYTSNKSSVTKWTPDGRVVGWIGGGHDGWKSGEPDAYGAGFAECWTISGLALDADGNLYVAEFSNGRISKWSPAGVCLGWIGGGQDGWQTGELPPPHERDAYGLLISPCNDMRCFHGIAAVRVEPDGTILALDRRRRSIVEWSADGTAIRKSSASFYALDLGRTASGNLLVANGTDDSVSAVGLGHIGGGRDGWHLGTVSPGSDMRSFHCASHVAGGPDGWIYVADQYNHRVSRWDENGDAGGWIGGGGAGWHLGDAPWETPDLHGFRNPAGIALDGDGFLYVIDPVAQRVVKWSPDGSAIGWIGGGREGWQTEPGPWLGFDRSIRTFDGPQGIYVDEDGTITVADTRNHRVVRWSADGVPVGWIGNGVDGWQTGRVPSDIAGGSHRQFRGPEGVWVKGNGDILVADAGNHRVSRWSANGRALGWIGGGKRGWQTGWGAKGGYDFDDFRGPSALIVDGSGDIYVSNEARVCRWSASGQPLGWLGGGENRWHRRRVRTEFDYEGHRIVTERGPGPRRLGSPQGLALDGDILYVADVYYGRVSAWRILDEAPAAAGWIAYGSTEWRFDSAPETMQDGQMQGLCGLACAPDGGLVGTDNYAHRLIRWSPAGE